MLQDKLPCLQMLMVFSLKGVYIVALTGQDTKGAGPFPSLGYKD